MTYRINRSLPLAFALVLLGGVGATALAQQQEHRAAPAAHAPPPRAVAARPAAPRGEPHPAPRGYQRVAEPQGWNARPQTVDKAAYQHNFQASRAFKIGPYRAPPGWRARRWTYGQILPRAFWAAQYVMADYWLFGLEVPPVGYEWVRYGPDALLVNVTNGQILEVEYGVFA
jgi:Ni/Co efflux regulator RcnB